MTMQADKLTHNSMLRVLKFLAKGTAIAEQGSKPDSVVLNAAHGAISIQHDFLIELARSGFLKAESDQLINLSAEGIDYLRLCKNKQIANINIHNNGKLRKVRVNLAESPLAALYRLKGAKGQKFLTDAEFDAGERLRSDFTRGLMMPRVTSNWDANIQNHSRSTTHGGVELSDAAMSARLRVEKALDAVGPELSGALVDVCCFLKTISQVETERCWPARSAKMMIKTGLSILYRHYHPVAQRKTSAGVVHWGAHDYRPSL